MYYSKKECNSLIQEWLSVDAQLKELEARKKELTNQLASYYEHMEKDEKERATTSLYSFKPVFMTNQTRFNQSLFKKEHSDLYAQYLTSIDDYSYFRASSFKEVK